MKNKHYRNRKTFGSSRYIPKNSCKELYVIDVLLTKKTSMYSRSFTENMYFSALHKLPSLQLLFTFVRQPSGLVHGDPIHDVHLFDLPAARYRSHHILALLLLQILLRQGHLHLPTFPHV